LIRLALALLLIAGAARAEAPVRVASKPDAEGRLLGQIILQVLGKHGVATVDRLGLGPTPIVRAALLGGDVDVYPEYTGNGAFFFDDESGAVWRDPRAGYERVRALDLRNHLVWLAPAPATNAWTIAVRGDLAQAQRLATMSDFSTWVNRGGDLYLAASAEFIESPAALPAFEEAYGFHLRSSALLSLAGGDTSATIRAAADRISGVNAAMAYGTDGALAVSGLVVMTDDLHAQAVYAPAPVFRQDALDAHAGVADWLDPVFGKLDEATLRQLNARIAVDGEDSAAVAADWLRQVGP
jgi:osmoprotectant transport system substrate-binding protein